MYEEQAANIGAFSERLDELRTALDIEGTKRKIQDLEEQMSAPTFWDDQESAQKVMQQLKGLKTVVSAPEELRSELDDAAVLIEMAEAEAESSMAEEIDTLVSTLEEKLSRIEVTSLLNDPRDSKNAIVNIHPGAGGTESCDWADMLYRMIVRFCERHEYQIEILDYQPGDEAGLKSASLKVSGPFAYGNLKSEAGVHRLVRISPYDAQSRRHTSFAAVEVLTEVDEDIDIEVREEDIKMDVYRASGAGGQHVNKTSSAVRLTHIPTGIVVACQVERSQHRNKATALNMLKAKLYDIEYKKQQAELDAQRESQQEVAWGSQIRSYTLHPFQLVKDHRTKEEMGNTDRVLDGDLDSFVAAYLKWNLERGRKN